MKMQHPLEIEGKKFQSSNLASKGDDLVNNDAMKNKHGSKFSMYPLDTNSA